MQSCRKLEKYRRHPATASSGWIFLAKSMESISPPTEDKEVNVLLLAT